MKKLGSIFFITFFLLVGCGGGLKLTRYSNPKANVAFIKRVAVLPLRNFSRDNMAHEKVRDILETELLSLQIFEVVDKGETDHALEELRISPTNIDAKSLKKLASRLGVQAVLTGAVDEYTLVQTGGISLPLVTISLKLIDAQSGGVIWQVTGTEKGGGALNRLFGIGEKTLSDVTQILIQRMLKTLS
ncbi:MAG: penicillin-binding protein activator LpoB [Candidatus Desulfofervidaceae bacterium]|nr:penicillin-binding protein activator LpoB [Candidatus Desulfofervidaceae bacterium]